MLTLGAAVLLAATGCAQMSTDDQRAFGSLSPQQKEAFELRRYCEANPNDVTKCLGFLGFH
jgi:hypothetical protein